MLNFVASLLLRGNEVDLGRSGRLCDGVPLERQYVPISLVATDSSGRY